MPTLKDQAICIRHWDWSETSQTVSLFTRDHGIVRGLAKGAKREKSDFSGGIELLTRGEVVAIVKTSARIGAVETPLAALTAWDLLETFRGASASLAGFHSAMLMAELVQIGVHEADPHPRVFDLLVSCLRGLASGGVPARWALRFAWGLLADTGHKPELGVDVRTGEVLAGADVYGFAPGLGGLTADHGARSEALEVVRVRAETVALLRAVEGEAGPGVGAVDRADGEVVRRGLGLLGLALRRAYGAEVRTLGPVVGSRAVAEA